MVSDMSVERSAARRAITVEVVGENSTNRWLE
jgi:hypothetical protein